MRIFILVTLVSQAIADGACGMYVASIYKVVGSDAAAVLAAADHSATSGGAQQHASVIGVTQMFDLVCNYSVGGAATANTSISVVPYPVTGTSYDGNAISASNFTDSGVFQGGSGSLANNAVAFVVGGSASTAFGISDPASNSGSTAATTCGEPQLKFWSTATCTGTNALAAVPKAAEGFPKDIWYGGVGASSNVGTVLSPLGGYGLSGAIVQATTAVGWVAATAYDRVQLAFHGAAACASALTAAAKVLRIVDMAMFSETDTKVVNTIATTPGRCMDVKAAVSFEFYCDHTTGTVHHNGYKTVGCAGAAATADSTAWAPQSSPYDFTSTAAWSAKGQQWKGVTGLFACLGNSSGALIDTDAKLHAICPKTTTPAPASGAAAVGTAAAVAAGAAALIL